MANDIVNHPAGTDQSTQIIYSLHFNLPQWQKFWNLMVVGSAMAELLASLENTMILGANTMLISPELVRRWIWLSEELIPVWESSAHDRIQ